MNNLIFSKLEEWDLHGETMYPGWYFWDETLAECHGPFSTIEECSEISQNYSLSNLIIESELDKGNNI